MVAELTVEYSGTEGGADREGEGVDTLPHHHHVPVVLTEGDEGTGTVLHMWWVGSYGMGFFVIFEWGTAT